MQAIESQAKKYFAEYPTDPCSEFMALYLGFGIVVNALANEFPRNSEQFWCCLRFLEECPSAKENLNELRKINAGWDWAVVNWEKLENATRSGVVWFANVSYNAEFL